MAVSVAPVEEDVIVNDLNWRGCVLFPSDVPEEALASAERMKMWLDGIGTISLDAWRGDARIDYTGPVEAPPVVERPLGCFFDDSYIFRKRCYHIMKIVKHLSTDPKLYAESESLSPDELITKFEITFPDTPVPLRPILDYDHNPSAGPNAHARISLDREDLYTYNRQIAWDSAIAWLPYNDMLHEMVDLYQSEETV